MLSCHHLVAFAILLNAKLFRKMIAPRKEERCGILADAAGFAPESKGNPAGVHTDFTDPAPKAWNAS